MRARDDATELELAMAGAWRAWDQRPGAPDTVAQLERAVKLLADQAGVNALALRRVMVAERRAGGSYLDAIQRSLDTLAP